MTASEIFQIRTGESKSEYIAMAEQLVREYLNYNADDSVDSFAFTIADVAVILWQKDSDMADMASAPVGVKSESFSEGAVSAKTDYLTLAEVETSYDSKVQVELDKIRRFRIARVPVEAQDADE